jgi:hypothetical protein
VAVSQKSYTIRKAIDPQWSGADAGDENGHKHLGQWNAKADYSQSVQNKAGLLDGEMAEWLKAAVC